MKNIELNKIVHNNKKDIIKFHYLKLVFLSISKIEEINKGKSQRFWHRGKLFR